METISFTIPLEYDALTRVSDMLHGLAIDLKKNEPKVKLAEVETVTAEVPLEPMTTLDMDKNGIPWDVRIHSSSKEMTSKGIWKRRKNVPQETFDAVEAELKSLMAIPTPKIHELMTAEETAVAPRPIDIPVPPVVDAIPTPTMSFTDLLIKITKNGIPDANVVAAVNRVGVMGLSGLSVRPDLIPSVHAELFPQ